MKRILLLMLGIFLTLNYLIAQVPNTFRYQAVVRNSAGELISNKIIAIKISILESSATGSSVYSEVFEVATNEFGIVAVNIGTGVSVQGIFSAIQWGSNSYYLQVEIDIEGGENYQFMGSSQILAVPYAMYAVDVKNNNDADADPQNEIQDLQLINNVLTITNNNNATEIPLSQYIGVDTDDQTLSRSIIGNTVEISIEDGNSINFDLPSDFVNRSTGGTFNGPIYATNILGSGVLTLQQNFSLSGIGAVLLNSVGPTNVTLPSSGTIATQDYVNQSITTSNLLANGNIWVGSSGVATAFPANGAAQILIGNGNGIGSFPISGDANMSSTGILTLGNSGVTPGSYFYTTVDAKGRVTNGSNPNTLAGFGILDGLTTNLSSGNMYVGNASNFASQVTMTGDASLSSTGALTLASTAVIPGTYKSVTVDTKGRITNGTNPTTLAGYGITDALSVTLNNANILIGNGSSIASQVVITGDASLSNTGILNLITTGVGAGTYRSVTVDTKGRITAGTNPTTLAGYGITDALSTILPNGQILVGNLSNVATGVSLSGDATISNTGVLTLANTVVTPGTYFSVTVDGKGRVTAGTNPTTLAGYGITDAVTNSLTSGQIFVGNGSNVATGVAISGDATIDNAGLLTLDNTVVTPGTYLSVTVDGKGRVTAGTNPTTIAGYGITDAVTNSLTSGQIFVGNGSNIATGVAISGDATIDNAGLLTLDNTVVTPGTYLSVTVDGKGRVTAGTNPTTASYSTINLSQIINMTPITRPGSANEGDIYVGYDGTGAGSYHIYCYLNGVWVQLDN